MFKKIIDLNKFSGLLLYTSILTFIIAFNFSDNPPSGWYQQFLPNLNGQPLSDVIFLDSLTGFAITDNDFSNDTGYILKTTNGGDNWNIIFSDNRDFKAIEFINLNTGYVCGAKPFSGSRLLKTTNSGLNWFNVNPPNSSLVLDDITCFGADTIWVAARAATTGGLFRTTNGGISWDRQFNKAGSGNPEKVYFYNKDIGFITGGSFLWKTTDSGLSWNEISGAGGFRDMFFRDSLVGYKAYNAIMQKTINGGINWINQSMPTGGYILTSGMLSFSHLSSDTIWGVGGTAFYGSGRFRGLIYRTLNGGINWLYQIPDTTIPIGAYFYTNFVNKLTGWCYNDYTGVHTKKGGDSIFTIIENNNSIVEKKYFLNQNYPNPFNPFTVISYQLAISKYIEIKVFDITGKQIVQLVNKKQNAGEYKINFEGSSLTSGVYFYSLFIDGESVETKKMILVR